MTPPLDDDSLQEAPEVNLSEPVHKEFKEYRELRSSTRALAVSFKGKLPTKKKHLS